ncbi:Cyclic di-GMP binding protein precursor [Pseudoalteromonas luteoviolacea B = ATCC 29581]|nr:Cyclic di-GMP binding protein precursor [Pseudoalteromonas luteoviolacea B = ATCC 29581]
MLSSCVLGASVNSLAFTPTDKSVFSEGYPEAAPITSHRFTFEQLNQGDIRLSGVLPNSDINFTNRIDKIIKELSITLQFTNSPALLTELSHIKVYLNEQLMAIMPINGLRYDQVHQTLKEQALKLKPHLVRNYNTIRFELIGHYTNDQCEDTTHTSIWAEIDQESVLEFKSQHLALESLLSRFPEPFYDEFDYTELSLPMVFRGAPNKETTQAAAILSSWFGAKANWRGAQFPVIYNTLPTDHAVVLATNSSKPDFLLDYPDAQGPTVEVIANPEYRYKKLLLILGRDEADLKTAVEGIALGLPLMTGRTALINEVSYIKPREAYDAPRWLRSDRAVRFGELIDFPTQLQTKEGSNKSVKLDVRLAPDLFTWRSNGLPIELKYRYTPPTTKALSRLNMSINDEFVQGFTLSPDGGKEIISEMRIPLLSSDDTDKDRYFSVPGFKVDVKNELEFKFLFSTEKEGFCTTSAGGGKVGIIDDDSIIDVSNFHHYIAMPNLHAYSQGGFPFTKYADLSETAILISKNPSRLELQTLFTLSGHFGKTTGFPILKASFYYVDEEADLTNKDVLLLGQAQKLTNQIKQDSALTVLLEHSLREITQAAYESQPYAYALANDEAATKVSLSSLGPLAAIVGFQSPFNSNRSVIALMATQEADLHLIEQTIRDSEGLAKVRGTATIINQHKVHNSYLGERYYVGSLPPFTYIWFHLSEHPLLLAILTLLTLLIISFVLWRILVSLARKRVETQEP